MSDHQDEFVNSAPQDSDDMQQSTQPDASPAPGGEAPPVRGREIQLVPGPGRLLALCAMVRGLGKGHGDAHPFMPEHGTEASLSPAAGTACAAACIVTFSHG